MADEMDDIARLLQFDPFSEGAKEPELAGAEPAEAEPEPEPETTEPEVAAPEPEPFTPAPVTELLETRRQLAELRRELDSLRQPVQPVQPQQPQVPDYTFTFPEQLQRLLDSEDPNERRQGLAYMAQGVARTVHMNAMQEVARARQEIAQLLPEYVRTMQAQKDEAAEVFNDFYGAHKELNRPELRPLVVGTAQQVMKETGATEWTPQLRDNIAARVKSIIGLRPARQSKQPARVTGGARPATPAGVSGTQADILDTLFGPGG